MEDIAKESVKNFKCSVVVGDVYNQELARKLVFCTPYFRRNFVTESSFSEGINRVRNFCSLDGGCCASSGRRLKFVSGFSGCRVVWVCPKLVGLPDLEK
jgi:hypothetical protein